MINEDSIYTQLREYYFYDCKWTSSKEYPINTFEDNMSNMFIDFQYNINEFMEEFWDYYEVY